MKILITGGAGFIGSNAADRLAGEGHEVVLLDNLSRAGSERNLSWLQERHPQLAFVKLDVRDRRELAEAFQGYGPFDAVFHLAAQVAVTTSVERPLYDFEVNARGTLNLLETARAAPNQPIVLYTSTNKVYGGLEDFPVEEGEDRYRYRQGIQGVPESAALDFHSPYGCSKGAADQYVRDYHRIYDLPTIVFRNSCIYGPRQFGIEDQGWLAWFVIAALREDPITIYGDGKQVRDVLFIDDLLDGMLAAVGAIDVTAGQVYNMGGGPVHSVSIWRQFGPLLEEYLGRPIPVSYGDWRPGDQRVYISDVAKAGQDFGWAPSTPVREGVARLVDWIRQNMDLIPD